MNKQKQFGVWMDSQQAIIVGSDGSEEGNLVVIAHVNGEEISPNSSEKNEHNQKKMGQAKYFKEIMTHMQNATDIHLTGTGTAQEQFMHFLEETPQFKNTKTSECTSNRMSDERLLVFMEDKLK
jgi:stalled ribosome rescue protein Dom34